MKYLFLSAILLAVSCNSEKPKATEEPKASEESNKVKFTCADGTVIEMKDSTWKNDGECDCPDCSDEGI